MSDHLPECPTTTDPHGLDDGYACPCECQCEILRACEERVRQEIDREAFVRDEGDPYREAYRTGLDAAREAVTRTCGHTKYEGCSPCLHDDALAAIDALRDQPADQTGYGVPNVRHLAADLITQYAEARHQPHGARYDCGRCDLTAALRAAAHDIRSST